MSARPWMPLWCGDFLADTEHLNCAESGAYLLLLVHLWLTGKLPDDDRRLARIARATTRQWRSMRPILEPFFDIGSVAGWQHKRVEAERVKASAYSEIQRGNANERWRKNDANAYARARATSQSHSQSEKKAPSEPLASPSSTKSTELVAHTCGRAATRTRVHEAFETFWKVHARRDGADPKKQAAKRFEAAVKGGTDPAVIIEAARAHAAELLAKGQAGTRFVPQAQTWLLQQRWIDHAPKPPPQAEPQPPDPSMPTHAELRARYANRLQ